MAALPKVTSSRERGVALVIVLAFVVLLTGLVIAHLSRVTTDRPVAHSSLHQTKADQVAASGMDLVIGDLRQEITGPLPTPTPPYVPLTSARMLPLRSGNPGGAPDPIPNLVRRSVRADPIPTPGISSFASAVNSTDVSANGRSISLARWNKHYLVPKLNTGIDQTDPVASFVAPDWVILTRTQRNPTDPTSPYPVAFSTWDPALKDQTPTNNLYALGRYAYAIYDEGGLLDMNVAGYPSSATAAQYGPKGVSAFADLTVIGASSGSVDAMVGWRNYLSANPSGNFPSFNFNAAAVTAYVNSVLSNTNGFMTVSVPSPTPNNMSRTDQQFPTRQSLMQLLVNTFSGATRTANENALQYLSSFSRELNAPSWTPKLNAIDMGALNNGVGNIYAYNDNANPSPTATPTATPTPINPNLLAVRVSGTFTRADGTSAAANDLLLNRRFPLSRINGLGASGPVTTVNSTIVSGVPVPASTTVNGVTTVQRDFGLLWNNAQNRWDYVGASGSVVRSTIERLDQVAAENREPNFFELLKAVILSGSVGMGSGTGNVRTFVNAETKYYSTPLSSDYQIMQIGANIIDQWDSNNVPTFINFGDPVTVNELAGIENLPYLNKLVFKPAWKKVSGKDQFVAWLLPSLWNPNQNAPPAAQNVRIAMPNTTQSMTAILTDSGTPSSLTSTPVAGSSTQFMTVDASLFGTVANPSVNNPSAPTAVVGNPPSTITQSSDGYYGFNFAFATNLAVTPANSLTAYPNFGASGCDFELQVQVNGNWKSYQKWTGCGPNNPLIFQPPTSSWSLTTLQDPEFFTLDPRTIRFGVWGNAYNQSGVVADYTNGTQGTLDWPAPRFELITALPPQGTMFSLSTPPYTLYNYANNASSTVHYTDLDTIQRQGDIISGSTTAMLPTDFADRPRILNRPFRSVAELGQVFRDQPWKTLSFTTAISGATANSADAGLLDVFTLHESSMEAGKTSLNTRQPLVLKAILSQATRSLAGTSPINATERDDIVTALTNLTTAQPMINKAELVTRLAADSHVTGLGNKEARELVMRAFSDACQTRTWNLLIDVIAQSGRYPPNASTLAGFLVEGEQHYWVHVAIDRFTGQVIDKQIEVVNE